MVSKFSKNKKDIYDDHSCEFLNESECEESIDGDMEHTGENKFYDETEW